MKKRLDLILFERGLTPSRERAKTTVMSGLVYVSGQKEDKPGCMVAEDAVIEVRGDPIGFVSRGGLKLQKAIDVFAIDCTQAFCADIGASTGGFTDCLLQHGASHVWAIDVGYGQLDWKLRCDPRVTVMERTNIRYVTPEQIGTPLTLATCDVSFISLRLVFPVMRRLLAPDGQAVCLVKPQFEAGRAQVGKKGVVRDPQVHEEVLLGRMTDAESEGFTVKEISFSPLKGPEGNLEYLLFLSMKEEDRLMTPWADTVAAVVRDAHDALG